MYRVVVCTVSSGRVRHIPFATWEAARQHADEWTEKKGPRVRVWIERVEQQATRLRETRTGRSIAA